MTLHSFKIETHIMDLTSDKWENFMYPLSSLYTKNMFLFLENHDAYTIICNAVLYSGNLWQFTSLILIKQNFYQHVTISELI